jgi:uncharacterized membrane protein YdbT with pleckstrin-like domain
MSFAQHLSRRHASTRGNRDTTTNNIIHTDESNNTNESSTPESTNLEIVDPETNDSTAVTTQDENVLIVPIPNNTITHRLPQPNITFLPMPSQTITTQQRRSAILAEVERVQRANFIHFALLCLVPTSLLLIVIAAIISQDGECNGIEGVTVCERESRSFVNAFTTRCVCDAVKSVKDESSVVDENGNGLF